SHLVPAALLALILGIFVVLSLRKPAPAPSSTATPEIPASDQAVAGTGPAKDVRPPVEAGPRVRGRVINENREPVEGARIWIGNGWWTRGKPTGSSAKDGRYDLAIPWSDHPGYLQLHVMADGYRPDTRRFGPLVGEKGPTIILHPSPTVRGVVLERGNWRRLGNVVVQAKEDSVREDSLFEVQARDDGSFEIAMLPERRIFLGLRGLGYKASVVVDADGKSHPPEDFPPALAKLYAGLAVLSVPPLGSALIRVRDEAGKPVAGAELRIFDAIKSDAEGRARFDNLPEGDSGVVVAADGCAPAIQEFKVAAGVEAKVDVVLKKAGARLYGTIAVAEGQPEPTSVEVWPGILGSEGAHCRHPEIQGAVAAGRKYSINVPHGEPVRLVVRFDSNRGEGRIPWFDRGSVTLSFGQSQERNLVVEPVCKLRIEAKDPKGLPVSGASVTWEGHGEYRLEREQFSGTLTEAEAIIFGSTIGNRGRGSGVTDAAGMLTVCVVKGEYKVDASHAEFKP